MLLQALTILCLTTFLRSKLTMLGDLELEERESKDSSFICTSTQYFERLFCGFFFWALLEVIVSTKIKKRKRDLRDYLSVVVYTRD